MAAHRAMMPYLLEAPERAGGLALALVGATAPLLGPHGPELVLWALMAMGLDLASGLVRALVLPNEIERLDTGKFLKGVLKKIATLMVLPIAAMVDRFMHISDLIADGAGPVAYAALVGICMYEGTSVLKNVQGTIGRAAFIARLLRTVDEFKAFPDSPPERRTYDKVVKSDPDPEDAP